jgi:hypothetical protein
VCRNLKQGTRPKAFEIVHRNEIRKTTISKWKASLTTSKSQMRTSLPQQW